MKGFVTEKRFQKIDGVIRARQHSLRIVLENIHDPHNVSAIFRTCDAVGVPKISLLYTIENFPKISKITSASARKWIEREKFKNTQTCFHSLHEEDYSIYATRISKESVNLYDLDLTKKIAFVLGNEHRGVSDDAALQADKIFYIPMYGMIQSLNVSVAAAVILYEAQRQRFAKGMYNKSELSEEAIENEIDAWCKR